ncbi:MAG: exopolyphosphatase [Desulfobacula sp.]|uniref:exopolyphosphatase n=1 Tax=Desulfobacula sp. TaxID=2593537 RepID=UPI0039B97DBA|nr:exopolyphosphatase [Desulfobacula sp.]
MRIVTRPDFDGIVCAVLLYRAENIDTDIKWVEPNEIQSGKTQILKGDIMANIPYSHNCSLWFDHHISNKPKGNFQGDFDIAPSAARVVYEYYKAKGILDNKYEELVFNTDIIDAADLTRDQVQRPENYPYILLSMTIKNKDYKDIAYWNKLVDLLREKSVEHILEDPEIKGRCNMVIQENIVYKKVLIEHTKIRHKISITDFRDLDIVPDGNRFLTYSLFPECYTSIKIRFNL